MKLTIDTKEDSHEEIKKAIKMLATIVGDEQVYTNSPPKAAVANIFDSPGSMTDSSPTPEPAQGSVFGNIFGDSSSSSSEPAAEEKKEEEKDKKPEIIIEY